MRIYQKFIWIINLLILTAPCLPIFSANLTTSRSPMESLTTSCSEAWTNLEKIQTARKILDQLQDQNWAFKSEYQIFFKDFSESEFLKNEAPRQNLKLFQQALKDWIMDSSNTGKARKFYHAAHLMFQKKIATESTSKIFHNNPPSPGNLLKGFIEFIEQMYFLADGDLRIASYQLNHPVILKTLEQLAYWIGPERIRIVVEEDYLHKDKPHNDPSNHISALKRILAAGISLRTDTSALSKGNGQAHHKFALVGSYHLFTGSWNPTIRGTSRNYNHAFWIQSKDLNRIYANEFEQIWEGKSQVIKKSQQDYSWYSLPGGKARVLFAPQDPLKQTIISNLQKAQHKILISLFFLTDPDILKLLKAKQESGLKVSLIIDNLGAGSRVSDSGKALKSILLQFGLEFWTDDGSGHWHHKAAVIDQRWILSGSANWSQSAFSKNDENLIQIDHPELASQLESIITAPNHFEHWTPQSKDAVSHYIPNFWEISRSDNDLRVNLPPQAVDWQIFFNDSRLDSIRSSSKSLVFIYKNFFKSTKEGLLSLQHPDLNQLHSIFLHNSDGKLSSNSLKRIKAEMVRNPSGPCSQQKTITEACLMSVDQINHCIRSSIRSWVAEPWTKCKISGENELKN